MNHGFITNAVGDPRCHACPLLNYSSTWRSLPWLSMRFLTAGFIRYQDYNTTHIHATYLWLYLKQLLKVLSSLKMTSYILSKPQLFVEGAWSSSFLGPGRQEKGHLISIGFWFHSKISNMLFFVSSQQCPSPVNTRSPTDSSTVLRVLNLSSKFINRGKSRSKE